MVPDQVWKCLETTAKRLLCYGFRRNGKAMGQLNQCWWSISREINVFPGSNIGCFTFCIRLWTIYWHPVVGLLVFWTLSIATEPSGTSISASQSFWGIAQCDWIPAVLTAASRDFPQSLEVNSRRISRIRGGHFSHILFNSSIIITPGDVLWSEWINYSLINKLINYTPKKSVFWDITLCNPFEINRRYGGTCHLHIRAWRWISQARYQCVPGSKKSTALAWFILQHKDEGKGFSRNVGWLSMYYAMVYPKRHNFS
jgi:hypothetical protein